MKTEHLRKKRTEINFAPYVLQEIKIAEPEIMIYRFGKPNTRCGSFVFINAEGVLTVTGDYGNWIFCREFYASADGYVSDGYWLEKLRNSSTQRPCEWDAELTRKEIEKRIEEEELGNEEKEYLEDLLNHLDDGEERYMIYAYDNMPDGYDYEYIPISKRLNYWLEAIFDAFDEICRRKENS
jgi:hypothetical protein